MCIVYCGTSGGPIYVRLGFNLDDGEELEAEIFDVDLSKKTQFSLSNSQLLSPKTEGFDFLIFSIRYLLHLKM
jgi:hypothetical protein